MVAGSIPAAEIIFCLDSCGLLHITVEAHEIYIFISIRCPIQNFRTKISGVAPRWPSTVRGGRRTSSSTRLIHKTKQQYTSITVNHWSHAARSVFSFFS